MRRRGRGVAVLVSVGLAVGCAAGSLYIEAKAVLAQALLERAWSRTAVAGGVRGHQRPWPWADTWPVARLAVPRLGRHWIVLAGASGRTLAFGPGHLDGTALPGDSGHSVVAGHRDTQFAALAALRPGDLLTIETPERREVRYRVRTLEIVERGMGTALAPRSADTLTLVTCWPFDAVVPGGPGRYVVHAERDGSRDPSRPAHGAATAVRAGIPAGPPPALPSRTAAALRGRHPLRRWLSAAQTTSTKELRS